MLGVSADPVGKLVRFRQKHDLSVPLLSDERHAMLEAYCVWGEKSMYGRTFMGVKRTTVLIGPDGRIAKLWQTSKYPGMRRRSWRLRRHYNRSISQSFAEN